MTLFFRYKTHISLNKFHGLELTLSGWGICRVWAGGSLSKQILVNTGPFLPQLIKYICGGNICTQFAIKREPLAFQCSQFIEHYFSTRSCPLWPINPFRPALFPHVCFAYLLHVHCNTMECLKHFNGFFFINCCLIMYLLTVHIGRSTLWFYSCFTLHCVGEELCFHICILYL